MELYRFIGKSFEELWKGDGEPWTRNTMRDAVETSFTDTRHPTGVKKEDEVELYVQQSNLDHVKE